MRKQSKRTVRPILPLKRTVRMKSLTFDSDNKSQARHFELIYMGLTYISPQGEGYRLSNRNEMRDHGKLMDAVEAISVANDSGIPNASPRLLKAGKHELVLDDAWLALMKRMVDPSVVRWLAIGSRDVIAMLDYLDGAADYVPPPQKPVKARAPIKEVPAAT